VTLQTAIVTELKYQNNKNQTAALLTANPPLQQNTIPHAVIFSSYAPEDGQIFVRKIFS
jgi:hypothetical protein